MHAERKKNKKTLDVQRKPVKEFFWDLRSAEIVAESAEDAGQVKDPPRADGSAVAVPAGFRALLAPDMLAEGQIAGVKDCGRHCREECRVVR